MDLSCDDKILQGVRELIKENILPRLTQIEQEVRELRRVCWPVCQSLRETSQYVAFGKGFGVWASVVTVHDQLYIG